MTIANGLRHKQGWILCEKKHNCSIITSPYGTPALPMNQPTVAQAGVLLVLPSVGLDQVHFLCQLKQGKRLKGRKFLSTQTAQTANRSRQNQLLNKGFLLGGRKHSSKHTVQKNPREAESFSKAGRF